MSNEAGNNLVLFKSARMPAVRRKTWMPAEERPASPSPDGLWKRATARLRSALVVGFGFSVFVNLLVLALPIYTLQVFDRVLSGRSVETLLALSGILLVFLMAQALLDTLRAMLLRRAGGGFEMLLNGLVVRHAMDEAARGNPHASSGAADLQAVRATLSSPNSAAVFDLPWAPLFLLLIFAMHPTLGWFVAGALALLSFLAVLSLLAAQRPRGEEDTKIIASGAEVHDYLRNADAIRALGMGGALSRRWSANSAEILNLNARVTSRVSSVLGMTKFVRMSVQGGIMGLGAYLVIAGQITPGVMIASSILMARALAPVEQAVSGWRGWTDGFAAYKRLGKAVSAIPAADHKVALPRPTGSVVLENVDFSVGPERHRILKGVSMAIGPGSALGVIGPSGAGKSTLARILLGSIQPTKGRVLYDGAQWSQWDPDRIGAAFGYLPQDVQLLNGTVAQNISRFEENASSEDVLAAAQLAGVHDLIVGFPKGYDTLLGEGGMKLSGGQRQRIGLARALFGNPSLLVLDEPNANLDPDGEAALHAAIDALKSKDVTVIVVSHSPNMLRVVNHLVVLRGGQITAIGPRDDVIRRLREGEVPTSQVGNKPANDPPSEDAKGA